MQKKNIYIIILINFIKWETSLFFSNDNKHKHIHFTYDVPSFYDISSIVNTQINKISVNKISVHYDFLENEEVSLKLLNM